MNEYNYTETRTQVNPVAGYTVSPGTINLITRCHYWRLEIWLIKPKEIGQGCLFLNNTAIIVAPGDQLKGPGTYTFLESPTKDPRIIIQSELILSDGASDYEGYLTKSVPSGGFENNQVSIVMVRGYFSKA